MIAHLGDAVELFYHPSSQHHHSHPSCGQEPKPLEFLSNLGSSRATTGLLLGIGGIGIENMSHPKASRNAGAQ